ncbi:hypothetical protein ACQEU3_24565 [Spirillospora sp. CA-253888]
MNIVFVIMGSVFLLFTAAGIIQAISYVVRDGRDMVPNLLIKLVMGAVFGALGTYFLLVGLRVWP